MLDNDQEGLSGSNQWAPYSLGRRDVPPDNLMKKVIAFSVRFLCFIQHIDGVISRGLERKKGISDNVFEMHVHKRLYSNPFSGVDVSVSVHFPLSVRYLRL